MTSGALNPKPTFKSTPSRSSNNTLNFAAHRVDALVLFPVDFFFWGGNLRKCSATLFIMNSWNDKSGPESNEINMIFKSPY